VEDRAVVIVGRSKREEVKGRPGSRVAEQLDLNVAMAGDESDAHSRRRVAAGRFEIGSSGPWLPAVFCTRTNTATHELRARCYRVCYRARQPLFALVAVAVGLELTRPACRLPTMARRPLCLQWDQLSPRAWTLAFVTRKILLQQRTELQKSVQLQSHR
jgi:hypothetical protein